MPTTAARPSGTASLSWPVRGFEAARNEAGLTPHLTLDDLRHAAASRLSRAGLDPVAAVRGHEDATVTLRLYAHLYDRRRTDEAVREALTGKRVEAVGKLIK